jgi:hypothetical protein
MPRQFCQSTRVQPSSWVESGIKISNVRRLNLFKFTDELQSHSDDLSERKKTDALTDEEEAELTGIWNSIAHSHGSMLNS